MRVIKPGNSVSVATGISAQAIATTARYLGSEIDNSTPDKQFDHAKVDVTWTAGSAPTAGETVELYILYENIAGTYEEGGVAADAIKAAAITVDCPDDTDAHTECFVLEDIQPRPFKLLAKNTTDQTLTVTIALELYGLGAR
jgi:hypothetical protein